MENSHILLLHVCFEHIALPEGEADQEERRTLLWPVTGVWMGATGVTRPSRILQKIAFQFKSELRSKTFANEAMKRSSNMPPIFKKN